MNSINTPQSTRPDLLRTTLIVAVTTAKKCCSAGRITTRVADAAAQKGWVPRADRHRRLAVCATVRAHVVMSTPQLSASRNLSSDPTIAK